MLVEYQLSDMMFGLFRNGSGITIALVEGGRGFYADSGGMFESRPARCSGSRKSGLIAVDGKHVEPSL